MKGSKPCHLPVGMINRTQLRKALAFTGTRAKHQYPNDVIQGSSTGSTGSICLR